MKIRILLTLLLILVLVLGCISGYLIVQSVSSRKHFINDIYFRLTRIEEYLDELRQGNLSRKYLIADELLVLDTICDLQRINTNNKFYYENPGQFNRLGDNIQSGYYADAELEKVQHYLNEAITLLSGKAAGKENAQLSYQRISDILVDFFALINQL